MPPVRFGGRGPSQTGSEHATLAQENLKSLKKGRDWVLPGPSSWKVGDADTGNGLGCWAHSLLFPHPIWWDLGMVQLL